MSATDHNEDKSPERRVIDLDRAATTPLDPDVRAAMEAVSAGAHGNPSARHEMGVAARRVIEEARAAVARAMGAHLDEVVFTSGGTEANNLGVLGHARAQRRHGLHVLVGAAEHSSVAGPVDALQREGFDVERIPLQRDGVVDLARFERLLRPDTVLVAQMVVSNLLGSIAPIARMARLTRARAPQARFHVDAVQGLGKVALSLPELGVDSCSLSAHKIHGPKGTGALVLRSDKRIEPLTYGGGQESGLRPGTENVAGIVGFAHAIQKAVDTRSANEGHLSKARAILADAIAEIPGARLIEPERSSLRVPSILAVLLPGPPAEVWLHHLEQAGVLTSVGSACQSRAKSAPAGLVAIGLDAAEARRVLRLSTSCTTTLDDAREAGRRLVATAKTLNELGLIPRSNRTRKEARASDWRARA